MRRIFIVSCATLGMISVALAQQPPVTTPPPGVLPPSITGRPPAIATAPAVVPVAAARQTAIPADRFLLEPRKHSPEIMQAVYSSRTAAEWLCRLHLPSGRFMPGVNPSLARPLGEEGELNQAMAARAVARIAVFTADEKLTACASQAILALLTLAPEDPADRNCRVPKAADRSSRVAFAAALALAIDELPRPDPKLIAEAEKLVAFLHKQCGDDGIVREPAANEGTTRTEGSPLAAGLCFEAILVSDKHANAPWKMDIISKGLTRYRQSFTQSKTLPLAASLLPAVAELHWRSKNEAVASLAFELADRLCDMQYSAEDGREPRWAGGFRSSLNATGEPTADSIIAAEALAAAVRVVVSTSDLTRYTKYRKATLNALAFSRGMQFTDESTAHFEKNFRSKFLLGGVCVSPTDGNLRIENAARLVTAQLRFLESGGERE